MLTDAQFVRLTAATYTNPVATWTGISRAQSIQGYLTTTADLTLIGFRGSKTPLEWALDFLALLAKDHETTNHETLGEMHLGFLLAAMTLYPQVRAAVREAVLAQRKVGLHGHSLGAILALIIGALLISDGLPVDQIVAFAPPRGGGADFVRILANTAIHAFRFGNDPVPEVVPWLLQPRELLGVGTHRAGWEGALSCHHMVGRDGAQGYLEAVTALDMPAAA